MERKNYLPRSISDNLPAMVRNEIVTISPNKQSEFLEEYKRKAKSVQTGYVLWFFLGWHYGYFRKWGLQVLLWMTLLVGVGLIWWLIDLFRIRGITENYNKDMAIDVLRNLRSISDRQIA